MTAGKRVSAQDRPPHADSLASFPDTPIGRLGQRGHGGGGPGSGISSELGWFLDGSYVVIVLGNYDLPGVSALYQKLMGFLAAQ